MAGDQIAATAGKTTYTGKVNGQVHSGHSVGRRLLDGDEGLTAIRSRSPRGGLGGSVVR